MGNSSSKPECCIMCDRTKGTGLGDKAGRCPECRHKTLFYERNMEVSPYEEPYDVHYLICSRSECSFEDEARCEGRARIDWAIYNSR